MLRSSRLAAWQAETRASVCNGAALSSATRIPVQDGSAVRLRCGTIETEAALQRVSGWVPAKAIGPAKQRPQEDER